MASAAITWVAGSEAGAQMRRLATVIEQASLNLADRNPTGASVVLTINDAPGGGAVASVLVSGGGLPTQPTYVV